MEFGPVPLDRATGAILAHSVKQGLLRLRKGAILSHDDIARLRDAGLDSVIVARLGPEDVHENDAAARLADAIAGPGTGLRASPAATGRVNLYVEAAGVVKIDRSAIDTINRIDPAITIATVTPWQFLGEGGMAATIKIIAYGVARTGLHRAIKGAFGAMQQHPVALKTACLVGTHHDAAPPRSQPALQSRLDRLGLTLVATDHVVHQEVPLADALGHATADLILILTSSATSDARDVAPAALRAAGGRVIHYGMPVDPGNLLFLGDLGGRPVIGLPGCARSPALNGADWVLERVACGVPVTPDDIMGLGVGGLLKEIATRPRPREG